MATELILGRESGASRLHIVMNGKDCVYGAAGSVPRTVSRQHCKLTVEDDGSYTLVNLKPENKTYVNGLAIASKRIDPKRIAWNWAPTVMCWLYPLFLRRCWVAKEMSKNILSPIWKRCGTNTTIQNWTCRSKNVRRELSVRLPVCFRWRPWLADLFPALLNLQHCGYCFMR